MAERGRTRRTSGKGRPDSGAPRASLYDEVTAKIIAQLEAGCFPWAQPWGSAAAVPGLPRNAVSGRPYSGVNVLILWGAVIEGGYAREELCAELTSAFLCAALGIVPTVRHADYLGSWLAVLRADNRAIFKAASQASKAADFLLTFIRESETALARAA